MASRPGDQKTEVFQPLLVAGTLRRVPGKRGELPEQSLQPHPIHSALRQPGQVTVRVRINLGLEQRIAVEGEVRIAKPKGATWASGGGDGMDEASTFGQGFDETEQRIRRPPEAFGKNFLDHPGQSLGSSLGGFAGPDEFQACASRLVLAQFHVEKIVLAQGEGELLRVPAEEHEQLLVG